jgi:serine/threonine-protein kinase
VVTRAEGQEDPERPADGESGGVPPGALSALLQDLAHVSEALPERPLPPPGTVIGRFELVREIGGGGFGVVFEARDLQLHRSVAFKLVRPGRLEAGAELLGREAEVIAQLSHPNLVTLFDVGLCDHGPYLVLELLRGETLEERRRRGRVAVPDALRIAVEIAKGLAHAHAQGVVHRDLKPSNVFLCQDGHVKLLDFGMSHAFGRRRVSGGTPAYMAPEQWRAAPEDERTDVYALGVMLFELLANQLPFPANDRGKAVLSDARAPALDAPGLPGLGALVGRMLEKDATLRPRDGAEVLSALSALQAGPRTGEAAPPVPVRAVRPWRRRPWAIAAVAALLAAGGGLLARRLASVGEPTPARARAIVVLPFANLSGSSEDEYLSDGLTEEVLHLLGRLRELKVAARSSSFYFKNRKVEIADVARRLGVDVVLEGSVRRSRERLRIGAELIDARSGFRIWSQTYDRQLEDVFSVQDDIARQVVDALELVLSRASEDEFRRPRAPSAAGYDLYLRARAHLRLPATPENLARATELFEQVVAADPAFAQAHAGLCEAWLARYELGRAPGAFQQAEAACERALSHDREAGEVYVALGTLHLSSGRYAQAQRELQHAATLPTDAVDALLGLARAYEAQHRLDDAEKTFEHALGLDPGYWRVHQLRGHFFFNAGRYAEAARSYAEEANRRPDNPSALNNVGAAYYQAGDFARAESAFRSSLALAPTRGAYSNVGTSAYYLGRFADAAEMYAKAVELAPGDHRMWGNLGDAYTHLPGRAADSAAAYRKAVALGEERLRINPADADALADLAHYHARLGHAARARKLDAEARRRDPRNAYIHYSSALVAVRLGEREAALAELERAVALGYQRALLAHDPGLEPLRGDPRFAALRADPRGDP